MHAIGYVQAGSGFAIAASQIPGLLTPLPVGSAPAMMSTLSHSREELDSLISAMAGVAPAEAVIGEFALARTAHYQLAVTP